jgi:hypothetical protein
MKGIETLFPIKEFFNKGKKGDFFSASGLPPLPVVQ